MAPVKKSRPLRFVAQQLLVPTSACVIVLLLMPSFLVFTQAKAGASPQIPGAAQAAPPSDPSPISSYRSIGAADPTMSVLVSVAIPLRNLPTLSSLVKQFSDPDSANFRHFLDHDEVSQMFLPTAGQYQSVLDYLKASGFTVESTALNSMIVVRGTTAQVNQYLGQHVQLFTNGTYSYYETTGQTTLSGAYSYGSNSTGLLMRPDFTAASSAASGAVPSSNVTFTEGGKDTKLLQSVYNSTGLLSKGINGTGYTIGLLDFYGYSLVSQDLALYDKTYGYPAPPSFTVSPIGPYNPNLGTPLGWDGEIDLDVQASHSMAPGANVVLYAANGELPLSSDIAAIVQDGKANVVSQSFGLPEWEYYEAGAMTFLFNSVFADDYYMLGSAMGMTFLAASGDGGGSGFSAGPQGGVEYPAVSPYVTTLGGTSTYISTTADGALSVNQTAWSAVGYVPYFSNDGGSGGGVSTLEPTPWYQSSLPVPASFPDGRMVPDLSLDSNPTPGIYVILHGSPTAIGGTSEASPLFAGLLTLLMGTEKGSLGLINPALYQLAGDAKTYQAAFTPITFGYTIPWTSKFGYNLATGWGTPNIGEIATLYGSIGSPSSTLTVNVGILNSVGANFTDFTPGQNITVIADVTTPSGSFVTTGAFNASLQTLGGRTTPVPLTYSSAKNDWTGTITVENESGIAFVDVAGSAGAGGQSGEGFATTFVGYLANVIQPVSPYPWTFLPGLVTAVNVTDLFGNKPPFQTMQVAYQSYSILSNTYTQVGSELLNFSTEYGYYQATLQANFTSGPMDLVTLGPVAGYIPFVSGISLLGSAIYPQVVTAPGSVAPGQSLTIIATLTAPQNIALTQSLSTGTTLGTAIAEGSEVTATLVSPSGGSLETISLPEQVCAQAVNECGAGFTLINGDMTIPANAPAGLYTVMLNARYNDETTGYDYTGSYYGQVYVAPGSSLPKISVGPSTLFEGENASIIANITSPDGKEVTNGVYTALFYPETAQYNYSSIMHSKYEAFALVLLTFDAKIDMWTANATMPSPYDSSLVSSIDANSEYYGGPYDVYVSGISAGGVPTSSVLSAQQGFYVQPYVYTTSTVMSSPQQTSRLALSNVTINAGSSPLTLSGDYFIGKNTVTGSNVTIASSMVNGTLNLENGQATLNGVTGGDVVATNAKIILQHSALSSLKLETGATASIDAASSAKSITPSLPVLTILSPVANASYTGTVDAQVAVNGSEVATLSFFLDGKPLPSLMGAPTSQVSYPLNTAAMPDGTHNFTVVAVQSDLLASSASVSFNTHDQLASDLAAANRTIGSLNGSLGAARGDIATLESNLDSANHNISYLTGLVYVAVAVALVGVVLAVFAFFARSRRQLPPRFEQT
jgi:subtilase family serine protease